MRTLYCVVTFFLLSLTLAVPTAKAQDIPVVGTQQMGSEGVENFMQSHAAITMVRKRNSALFLSLIHI